MTENLKDQHMLSNGPRMPERPIVVFDVNETLLNLDAPPPHL